MKKLFLLLSAIAISVSAWAKDAVPENYQITGDGATNGGTQLVSVSIMSKKANNVTDQMLIAAAVHGVLFRDFADTSHSGYGAAAQHKALCGSPTAYEQHIDFFRPFFEDGQCQGYASKVDDTRRVVKVGKQYKVTSTVQVNEAQLRKDLQQQGVLKSLKSGW